MSPTLAPHRISRQWHFLKKNAGCSETPPFRHLHFMKSSIACIATLLVVCTCVQQAAAVTAEASHILMADEAKVRFARFCLAGTRACPSLGHFAMFWIASWFDVCVDLTARRAWLSDSEQDTITALIACRSRL